MLVLKGRRDGGRLIAFAPDGRSLVVRSEAGLQIWRGLTNGAKPELLRDIIGGWFRFTPDGRRLYLDGGTSDVLDIETKVLTPIPPTGTGYRYVSLAPDGQHVITTNSPERRGLGPCHIDYWLADRVGVGAALWSVTLDRESCRRAMFLADDRFALPEAPPSRPGHQVYCFAVHAMADGAALAESPTFENYPDWQAVSTDGRWIAGAKDRHIVIWDTHDLRRPAAEWDNDNRRSYTDLAFHPSGKYLAATSNDQTVKLYDTTTWVLNRTFTWDIGKMIGIAFSPDGTLAAAGSDTGKVVVWDGCIMGGRRVHDRSRPTFRC